jgi:serine/threonine-protein kinase
MATRLAYAAYLGEPFGSLEPTRAAARRALDLNPALPEARAALAFALLIEGATVESGREYQKALAVNPNSALLHHWYSLTLENEGRLDEALAEITRATELDPLSGTALFTRQRMAMFARRYGEALEMYGRAEGLLSENDSALAARAICLLKLGRADEAVANARKVSPHSSLNRRIIADAAAIYVLRVTGNAVEAEAHAAAIMPRLLPGSYQRGAVLAAAGRWSEAEPLLEKTPSTLHYLYYWDPLWDSWRDDPRFLRLMEKLGCMDEYKVARATLSRMQRQPEAKP